MQVAAVEPQPILLRGLPHVPLFALPRPGVLGGVRAKTPHLANLVRYLLRDQLGRPPVHGAIAGGQHDQVSFQFGAVGQRD